MDRDESTPPRFHCPVAIAVGRDLVLPDDVARHAVRSLRLRVGDVITLFDGRGGEYRARVVRARDPATVAIEAHAPVERESPLAVTLAQGVAAADRMDFVVQKAVELGVRAIDPVITERSVSRLDQDRAARRQAHWRQVVVSACEQCGRNRVPTVSRPIAFEEWIRVPRGEPLRMMLSTRAARPMLTQLREAPPDVEVLVLAGPEGGFSAAETRIAERHGFQPVTLGPRTLRTETAALAALAALQSAAGDLR